MKVVGVIVVAELFILVFHYGGGPKRMTYVAAIKLRGRRHHRKDLAFLMETHGNNAELHDTYVTWSSLAARRSI